jgi:SPP1 gp7 family putative phage head morphogenesis protein
MRPARTLRAVKKPIVKGTRLNINVSMQARYRNALHELTHRMVDETRKQILRLFNGKIGEEFFAEDASIASQATRLINALTKRFSLLFEKNSKKLASDMLGEVEDNSRRSLTSSLSHIENGLIIKPNFKARGIQEVIKASISENVGLIKSIPAEYLGKVEGAVMRSITTGNGLQSLVPELKKYTSQTDRRVKNLALDQTRKAYNSINFAGMKKVGIKKFEWLHSGGSDKPRQNHIEHSGKIYSFDDPPKIEGTDLPDMPGLLPNCGCTALPVREFEEEDL